MISQGRCCFAENLNRKIEDVEAALKTVVGGGQTEIVKYKQHCSVSIAISLLYRHFFDDGHIK